MKERLEGECRPYSGHVISFIPFHSWPDGTAFMMISSGARSKKGGRYHLQLFPSSSWRLQSLQKTSS